MDWSRRSGVESSAPLPLEGESAYAGYTVQGQKGILELARYGGRI